MAWLCWWLASQMTVLSYCFPNAHWILSYWSKPRNGENEGLGGEFKIFLLWCVINTEKAGIPPFGI